MSSVPIYRDDYNDYSIVVETEKVGHLMFDKLVRVRSVVITRHGENLGYSYPRYEGTSEAKVVDLAIANAKIYIQNRA